MPAHARSEDLIALFSGLAPVAEAKVIGGQGFGFVTFMDPEMAADVLAVTNLVLLFRKKMDLSHDTKCVFKCTQKPSTVWNCCDVPGNSLLHSGAELVMALERRRLCPHCCPAYVFRHPGFFPVSPHAVWRMLPRPNIVRVSIS